MNCYTSLIAQCTNKKSLTTLKSLHTHILKSGSLFSFFGHKLIDGYIKCSVITEARKLFDEMPNRHIVTWNSMISSHVSRGKTKEAIELYSNMLFEGVLPDAYTFSAIFKAFSEMGVSREGQKAHGLAVVLGFEVSDGFVATGIVDMYAKFGKMKDARFVFDRVLDKDVVLFTALIVGYNQHGLDGEALEVFEDMVGSRIKPNEYTLASVLVSCGNLGDLVNGKLIHGLVVKYGLESVVASQTSLLTMYSKCNMVEDSIKVFNSLAYASHVTWTSFIVGLVQNGREEVALSMFREMMRCSISPNHFTLSSILHACSSLAMLEAGEQIHAVTVKLGVDGNKFVDAALIHLYGKCGNVEKARSVFDSLTELDIVSINTMIYAYAQNGFGHEALELFERLKKLGLEPNVVTFISILLACNNAGLVEEGCQIFSLIRNNHSIELTRDHYTCMIDLLGRAKRFEEATMLIEEGKNPDVIQWRTLLNACKIHGEVEMAEKFMKKMLDQAPRDGGTHILLTNIYASAGKWDNVIEMKSAGRDLRLKKTPAMSWVDIDREVHTFMAGDLSHPRAHEISEMLHELIEKVITLGYNPDTKFVLQDLEEEKKISALYYHSEKLAIAFALWKTCGKNTAIRIFKNLRVCGDYIIARDAKRFHHFKGGICSCKDYW
ncbi:pentatricopeptide (PPR) repeat protein [Medicago truncatula]|uniref:Pentatricopeptide (PPR) repeat protein n=1 Tax=Medicago truncatula TaxID=3880 RepID=G7ZVM9_MEDTR|nr:pentatricopeptide (PPR) repeat protein [Medicago truncatula]